MTSELRIILPKLGFLDIPADLLDRAGCPQELRHVQLTLDCSRIGTRLSRMAPGLIQAGLYQRQAARLVFTDVNPNCAEAVRRALVKAGDGDLVDIRAADPSVAATTSELPVAVQRLAGRFARRAAR